MEELGILDNTNELHSHPAATMGGEHAVHAEFSPHWADFLIGTLEGPREQYSIDWEGPSPIAKQTWTM